jgi:hypothetical protein
MTQQSEKGGILRELGIMAFLLLIGAGGLATYVKMNPTSIVTQFLLPTKNQKDPAPAAVQAKLSPDVVRSNEVGLKVKEALATPLASFDFVVQNYDGTPDSYTILLAAERTIYASVQPLLGDAKCLSNQNYTEVVVPVRVPPA